MIENIGVIGLGNMGCGMALSLRRSGFVTWGYDAASPPPELADQGIKITDTAQELAAKCDLILLSLPNSAVVEEVVLGVNGILSALRVGTFLVDTTTADPASTRRLAPRLQDAGVRFVDAPVSGGPQGAANATMLMVMGGTRNDIEAVEPVLSAISSKRVVVGPIGSGHTAKLINNLLTGAHLLLASEAVRLAEVGGIDAANLIEALNNGSGRNSATLTNYPLWILNEAFDSGFTMKLMRKDIRLAELLLEASPVPSPVAAQAVRIWLDSEAMLPDSADFNRIVTFSAPASALPEDKH